MVFAFLSIYIYSLKLLDSSETADQTERRRTCTQADPSLLTAHLPVGLDWRQLTQHSNMSFDNGWFSFLINYCGYTAFRS